MGLIQKLGGRKFWMALMAAAVAVFLELHSDKGLTPTMAGFLGSLVGMFSVANSLVTTKHMDATMGDVNSNPQLLEQGQALINVLGSINERVTDTQNITANTGKLVANHITKGR